MLLKKKRPKIDRKKPIVVEEHFNDNSLLMVIKDSEVLLQSISQLDFNNDLVTLGGNKYFLLLVDNCTILM